MTSLPLPGYLAQALTKEEASPPARTNDGARDASKGCPPELTCEVVLELIAVVTADLQRMAEAETNSVHRAELMRAWEALLDKRWSFDPHDFDQVEAALEEVSDFAQRLGRANASRSMRRIGIDQDTEEAVRRFLVLIAEHYDFAGAILYGSRARGTHRPDSDADVAVLLKGERQRALPIALDMADAAFSVLLDTDINISPLPVWLDDWDHPETHPNPDLLRNIATDGVRLRLVGQQLHLGDET